MMAALLAAGTCGGVELYVSPAGNDAWSGRLAEAAVGGGDGPFATLLRARDEIRALKAKGPLSEAVTVTVRGGIYAWREPLVLGAQDSGTAAAPVLYRAQPGEAVILRGSVPIQGWRPWRDGIFQAEVSGLGLSQPPRQLFFKGQRQPLARSPNVDPEHPRSGGFLYVTGEVEKESKTLLQYNPALLDPSVWSQPQQVRVHVWSWLNWNRSVVAVKSVDSPRSVITLAGSASYKLIRGNRFFVENALEMLDAPGEWFVDADCRFAYFLPPGGAAPADGEVTVPVVEDLVRLEGNAATGAFVGHVRLHGFRFEEAQKGLVSLKLAEYCAVTGSRLTNGGGAALTLGARSHHNRIAGCDIAHVGGPGIEINAELDWEHRLENRVSFNEITNNHVHDVGEGGDAWGAIRLNPSCGGNVSHDNVISHNLVHDTPRQGISFNGFRNIVEYNEVHHTNQEQSDTGAIGMGSRDIYERGSVIRFNYIHDTGGYNMLKPGVWEYPHYSWGVYLDDYTSGVQVYGNLIVRAYRAGVMVHGGQDNTIEGNVIVDSRVCQVEYAPIDSLVSGRTPAHPDKSEWLMSGTRCLGNVFAYSDTKAKWLNGSKWSQVLAASERNLIWPDGGLVRVGLRAEAAGTEWAAWQALGYDRASVSADPLFVDAAKDDYRLRPESPALALGFKALPLEKMGLYESPERASWPVKVEVWRETHLTHPGGLPEAPAKEPVRYRAVSTPTAPLIDGNTDAPEWPWETPGAKAMVTALSMEDGKAKQPSWALVMADGEALYIALVNRVADSAKLLRQGGVWGQNDGAEVCLQDASGAKPGPIFVVQGFPSGVCESVDHAGAPAEAVLRLGQAVRYAARIGEGQWTGEWRIPFAALGLEAAKVTSLRFNIGVLKAAEREWTAWVSTGGAPWRLEQAGELLLK
jgi:hypothetical protein